MKENIISIFENSLDYFYQKIYLPFSSKKIFSLQKNIILQKSSLNIFIVLYIFIGLFVDAKAINYQCNDLDGKNYFQKSYVDWNIDGYGDINTDYCENSGALVEYFCNEISNSNGSTYKIFSSEKINCSNGCNDGACIYSSLNRDYSYTTTTNSTKISDLRIGISGLYGEEKDGDFYFYWDNQLRDFYYYKVEYFSVSRGSNFDLSKYSFSNTFSKRKNILLSGEKTLLDTSFSLSDSSTKDYYVVLIFKDLNGNLFRSNLFRYRTDNKDYQTVEDLNINSISSGVVYSSNITTSTTTNSTATTISTTSNATSTRKNIIPCVNGIRIGNVCFLSKDENRNCEKTSSGVCYQTFANAKDSCTKSGGRIPKISEFEQAVLKSRNNAAYAKEKLNLKDSGYYDTSAKKIYLNNPIYFAIGRGGNIIGVKFYNDDIIELSMKANQTFATRCVK